MHADAHAVGSDGVCPGLPNKPVRMIVGFGAGGSVDLVAHVLTQEMPEVWAQPVIVENRAAQIRQQTDLWGKVIKSAIILCRVRGLR